MVSSYMSKITRKLIGLSTRPNNEQLYQVVRNFATYQDGIRYQQSHEWAKLDGDIATVGISDYAQESLGEIVYVELPEVGSDIGKGDQFGIVESTKAASDVYSPLTGKVTEKNEDLSSEAGKVNTDPFTDGWLMKVQVSNKSEYDELMDTQKYKQMCDSQEH